MLVGWRASGREKEIGNLKSEIGTVQRFVFMSEDRLDFGFLISDFIQDKYVIN